MSNPRDGTPEQDKYKGMRRIVFFIMILVPLVPFIPVLGIGYYYFTGSLQTNTLATVNRIVEDHRQMIETFLRERRANLEFVVNSYSYTDLAEPEKFYHCLEEMPGGKEPAHLHKSLQEHPLMTIDLFSVFPDGAHDPARHAACQRFILLVATVFL